MLGALLTPSAPLAAGPHGACVREWRPRWSFVAYAYTLYERLCTHTPSSNTYIHTYKHRVARPGARPRRPPVGSGVRAAPRLASCYPRRRGPRPLDPGGLAGAGGPGGHGGRGRGPRGGGAGDTRGGPCRLGGGGAGAEGGGQSRRRRRRRRVVCRPPPRGAAAGGRGSPHRRGPQPCLPPPVPAPHALTLAPATATVARLAAALAPAETMQQGGAPALVASARGELLPAAAAAAAAPRARRGACHSCGWRCASWRRRPPVVASTGIDGGSGGSGGDRRRRRGPGAGGLCLAAR